MPYATALTTLEGGRLEPVNQNALRFYDQIAYDDDYNGLALDEAEGDRMCAALGNRQIMFMANHGVSVIGHSVAFAFDSMYYLERACRNQVLAMSTGRPLKRVPDDLARKVAQQIAGEDNSDRHFAALKRILDREEPDYAATLTHSSDDSERLEAGMLALADHQMVVDHQAHRLGGGDYFLGHVDVGPARRRIAARVIVDQDDR